MEEKKLGILSLMADLHAAWHCRYGAVALKLKHLTHVNTLCVLTHFRHPIAFSNFGRCWMQMWLCGVVGESV